MAFSTNYNVGGELDKVRKIDEIRNFAQLNKPYNKMVTMMLPVLGGKYELEYISPNVKAELLSLVVTCTGYGEEDYYNLYVDDELWFETWYPSEVKEGLYIGTSTYVYELKPSTKIKLEFHNKSKTSKRVWLGVRMLIESGYTNPPANQDDINTPAVPTAEV